MNFLQITQAIPDIRADIIFMFYGFPITNSIILIWLIIPFLIIFSFFLKKYLCLNPVKKIQLISEIIIEAILKMLNQITQSKEKTKVILPIIGTVFIFFLISNLITLIPGVGAITFENKALLRTPTTDLNTTLAVAILVMLLVQFFGIRSRGILEHIGQYLQFKKVFISFKKGIGKGLFSIIDFLMGILDITQEFAKMVSLSLRLFGNMFANEVLIVVIMSFLALIAPSILIAQTLLIGTLQAAVFSILSAVYLSLAVDIENNKK